MPVGVVGVSHHTAPVEVRERFAVAEENVGEALARVRALPGVSEAVVLSTCNRTEYYVHPASDERVLDAVQDVLARPAGPLARPVDAYVYRHRSRHAVRHLYRVASGLDSLVLGEAEIQGQVKHAYHASCSEGSHGPHAGPVLSRLFQTALAVGGRVRTETAVGEGAASVASVAVELARKIFGSLRSRRALVLGAGQTAELVVQALAREGVADVAVVNRTPERAAEVARRLGASAHGIGELSATLAGADIVVASTAAPHPVLLRPTYREAFPRGARRPLLIVDIAIPRDVDPALADEPNVFLYNIDDLRTLVDETLRQRSHAMVRAEELIAAQAEEFATWYASLDVVPVIRSLRERAEAVRDLELDRLARRLAALEGSEREALEEFSHRLVNKLLHLPTVRLREGAADGRAELLVDAVRYLFGLDEDADPGEVPPAENGGSNA